MRQKRRVRAHHEIGVAGIVLLALGVRMWRVGAPSIWVDEAFSVWLARKGWELITWVVQLDQHPPMYYLLLAGWGRVWGWGEAAVRSLSALWGALAVWMAFRIGREIGGTRLGMGLAFLLTLSPLHVQYGREARMYALLVFWWALALWGVLRVVGGRGNSRRGWGALVLGTLGALYTHNTGVFLLLAVVLSLLGYAWRSPQGAPPVRTRVRWVVVGLFLGWSLWLPVAWYQALGILDRFWIPFPTVGDVYQALHAFNNAFLPSDMLLGWNVGLLVLAGLGVYRLVKVGRGAVAGVLLATFLVPVLGELVISLRRPIFHVPSLLGATLAYYALVWVGITALPRRGVRWGIVLVWLLLNVWGLRAYTAVAEREPWRDAVRYVAGRVHPSDLILFHGSWVQLPFDYYFAQYGLAVEERGVPVDLFARGELEPEMRKEGIPRLRALVQGHKRVWLIYSHEWYTDPEERVLHTLEAQFPQVNVWQWPAIRVFLFEKGTPE